MQMISPQQPGASGILAHSEAGMVQAEVAVGRAVSGPLASGKDGTFCGAGRGLGPLPPAWVCVAAWQPRHHFHRRKVHG
jgi:hypothetical protein